MLKFPKLGSVVRCPVVIERQDENGETVKDYEFEVGIKLMGATQARAWTFRYERNRLAERKRIADLKRADPDFDGTFTEEGAIDGAALSHDIVANTLVDIIGLEFEGAGTTEDIVTGLEGFGLIEAVAGVALTAQSPRPQQLLSSGS